MVWEVSGQVNFLSLSTPAGTMFTAANISVGALSFNPPETATITAEQVARLGNIIRNTSMVPRTIDVPDGASVFLVAGSFNPNPNGLGLHYGGQDQEQCLLTPYCVAYRR